MVSGVGSEPMPTKMIPQGMRLLKLQIMNMLFQRPTNLGGQERDLKPLEIMCKKL